uniref:(northern house mosquito) hypothetical protein n=1 Tax=Culex pipiens TaxID=7175 RepID=A0A8D8FBB0_CULPI
MSLHPPHLPEPVPIGTVQQQTPHRRDDIEVVEQEVDVQVGLSIEATLGLVMAGAVVAKGGPPAQTANGARVTKAVQAANVRVPVWSDDSWTFYQDQLAACQVAFCHQVPAQPIRLQNLIIFLKSRHLSPHSPRLFHSLFDHNLLLVRLDRSVSLNTCTLLRTRGGVKFHRPNDHQPGPTAG